MTPAHLRSHSSLVAAVALALALALALCGPASAQPVDRDQLIIGIGGGVAPAYDGAKGLDFQPGGILQGRVSGFDFAVRGPNIQVDLAREAPRARLNLIAGPIVQLRLDRTSGIDDPRVALFGKRKAALELGGQLGVGLRGWPIPPAQVSAEVGILHDVTGQHGSLVIKPSLRLASPVSQRSFAILAISAEHVGSGYARHYFDVPAIAAPVPTLPGYAMPGGGFKEAGVTLLLTHDLGGEARKGWSLFALGGYSRLLGAFARSPIVSIAGEAGQPRLVGGVAYSF